MKATEPRETISGIPVKACYTPEDIKDLDYQQSLGSPGEPPYTRGAYPGMYRDKLWRIFELAGYGKVEESRDLAKFLKSEGGDVVFFMPDRSTFLLYDIDHPNWAERKDEIGAIGTPFMTLRDYEELLEGIPIDKIYCHPGGGYAVMSPFIHACYFSVAEKRGIPLCNLSGTGESCYFCAFLSQLRDDLVPPHAALRLDGDLIEFCARYLPRWMPVSIAGYNARECGVNVHQELALILANAIAYFEEVLRRGKLKIDDIAYAIGGVTVSTTRDFFETVCSMRAARRMWYKLLSERYGAKEARSFRLRLHTIPQGSGFTYQQPLNNVVRGTYMGLAAALGGVQSMGMPRFDEAMTIPSKEGFILAVRTQQILQMESNIDNVVDPLAGSYYVEWLTNEIENKAWESLREIEGRGGFIAALESGWLHKIAFRGATEQLKKIDSGETKLVGVNCYQMEEEPFKVSGFKAPAGTWESSMAKLGRVKKERDQKAVERALGELRSACASDRNVMEVLMKAVKAYVTIGEVGQVFREVFGTWSTPSI